MRFPIALLVVVSLLLTSFVSAKDASDSGLHTFYGEVVAIDQAAKVIQLKNGNQRFLFHYNDQTKMSSSSGHFRLDRIVRGTGAAVVMRVGEGKAGIALVIRFVPESSELKSMTLSAKTVHGETIAWKGREQFYRLRTTRRRMVRRRNFSTTKQHGLVRVVDRG
jgi:hypothetical protein